MNICVGLVSLIILVYIGKTTRHFHTRDSEHLGISPHTGAPLLNTKSKIFQHKFDKAHSVKKSDFKIVHSNLNEFLVIHSI